MHQPTVKYTLTCSARLKPAAARVQDEFLKEILTIIAEADPKLTPEEIAASVPADKMSEIAASRISVGMFEVFTTISERDPEDQRLLADQNTSSETGS